MKYPSKRTEGQVRQTDRQTDGCWHPSPPLLIVHSSPKLCPPGSTTERNVDHFSRSLESRSWLCSFTDTRRAALGVPKRRTRRENPTLCPGRPCPELWARPEPGAAPQGAQSTSAPHASTPNLAPLPSQNGSFQDLILTRGEVRQGTKQLRRPLKSQSLVQVSLWVPGTPLALPTGGSRDRTKNWGGLVSHTHLSQASKPPPKWECSPQRVHHLCAPSILPPTWGTTRGRRSTHPLQTTPCPPGELPQRPSARTGPCSPLQPRLRAIFSSLRAGLSLSLQGGQEGTAAPSASAGKAASISNLSVPTLHPSPPGVGSL